MPKYCCRECKKIAIIFAGRGKSGEEFIDCIYCNVPSAMRQKRWEG